jgi:hypothetical protein
MTYDLRRLRQHGLIERIPRTFGYQVTGTGIAQALFLTRLLCGAASRPRHHGTARLPPRVTVLPRRFRARYQMRVIACLLDAGGHPLPDGFVNAGLRRRLGMRGAAVEGMRGIAGDPAVFPRITGSVMRLVTG